MDRLMPVALSAVEPSVWARLALRQPVRRRTDQQVLEPGRGEAGRELAALRPAAAAVAALQPSVRTGRAWAPELLELESARARSVVRAAAREVVAERRKDRLNRAGPA